MLQIEITGKNKFNVKVMLEEMCCIFYSNDKPCGKQTILSATKAATHLLTWTDVALLLNAADFQLKTFDHHKQLCVFINQ